MKRKSSGKDKKAAKKPRYDIKKIAIHVLVILTAVYFVYTIIWQQTMLNRKNEDIKELQSKIEAATIESERLKNEIESMDDPEYIERIAREELGMVRPNERVFVDSNKSEDNTGN